MSLDLSPLWISLQTSLVATVVTFGLGVFAAWAMLPRRRHAGILEGLFLAPLVLPPTVLGFLLLLLLGKQSPVGTYWEKIFGHSLVFTWSATVVSATLVAFPLMYMTARGAFRQVDVTLLNAARTLGASEFKVFWKFLLPLSWPGIAAGTVLSFARALGEFGATLVLAGNLPGVTQTIPIAIYFDVEAGDYSSAALWSAIVMFISIVLLILVNRLTEYENNSEKVWGIISSKAHKNKKNNVTNEPLPRFEETTIDIQKSNSKFSLGVAFCVSNKIIAVCGESGAGKSMLLRCIAGLETPEQGIIRVCGRTLFDSQLSLNIPARERNVGVVFQNYALFPHLTVFENIAFGLKDKVGTARKSKVDEVIRLLRLQDLAQQLPSKLSGGQQQRVALARALVREPDVLLLDEPFSALDAHLRVELEEELQRVLATFKGITLIVSHNVEELLRLSNYALFLSHGRLLAEGASQQIFSHPRWVEIARMSGCRNISRAEKQQSKQLRALDWDGITLQSSEGAENGDFSAVGFWPRDILLLMEKRGDSCYRCQILNVRESLFSVQVQVKLAHDSDPVEGRELYIWSICMSVHEWHLKALPKDFVYMKLFPEKLLYFLK
jgi:molybdate transport system permease protein